MAPEVAKLKRAAEGAPSRAPLPPPAGPATVVAPPATVPTMRSVPQLEDATYSTPAGLSAMPVGIPAPAEEEPPSAQ